MGEDLARSGLTPEDIDVKPSLTNLRRQDEHGYFLSYRDWLTGKPSKMVRFRSLQPASGFAKLAGLNHRYDQPEGIIEA